jgi:hypothetical protein
MRVPFQKLIRSRGTTPSVVLLLLLLSASDAALAQSPALSADLPRDGFIARTHVIDLRSSMPLDPATQRVAVFIGGTDVSAILETTPTGWRYDGTLLPLPAGDHELVAWIVQGDTAWHEALRVTFRTPGALGIETAAVRPRLDLGIKSRLASAFEPAAPNERDTFNDFDGQLGIETEIVRHDGLRFTSRAQLAGHSERNRALRFSQLSDDAPKVDLSSYVVQARTGPLDLAMGNVSIGNARHLIQGFTSRGATAALDAGSRVQLAAGALHGSNPVGFDDLVGLGEPDHRILTASLGLEALRQPGALRVEVSALDGTILPSSGFNRGAITDAEASTGFALRVQSQALGRRLRVEGTITRSTFDNPDDPLLQNDTTLVAVERETRDARWLQASFDVLRGIPLGGGRTARLTMGWSNERVDPLFRSVATSVRADQLQNRWEMRGDVAGVSISVNHATSRNNLADLANILTSHNRRTGFDLNAPLATVLRGARWLPQLRWRADRTHQFGAGVPVNGAFTESHVPDQVSISHTAHVDTRVGPASISYRLERSKQDNRQVGREDADLETTTNAISAAVTPLRALSVRIDLAHVAALSRERDESDRTRRVGLDVSWSPLAEAVVGIQVSGTHGDSDARATTRDDRAWSVQWTSPMPGLRRFDGKWLFRFARSEHSAVTLDGDTLRRDNWMVDAGFNMSFR